MKTICKKITSIAVVAAMMITSFTFSPVRMKVNAQQSAGNAPFINSWLISGPFEEPVVDKIYGCEVEEIINLAPLASELTASSSTLSVNPVSYLVDGSTRNQWVTQQDPSPWVNMKWKDPIDLTEVSIAQWGEYRFVNNWYHITFTLKDGSKIESGQVNSTSNKPSEPTVYKMSSVLSNVVEMKVEIDKGRTPFLTAHGISEIEVYNRENSESNPNTAQITPKLGEALSVDSNSESQKWEYFDDRIYNRNYDDYQDLYGYYKVKKGIDTRNKYVNAHTYVYSPVEQQAYFNVGASGSYRLYVNDKCVTAPSVAVEVQKDLTKQAIQLKQGWNKLMIQIKHTYTEDVNANNVPTGLDDNAAYLGFYGRVADQNGNKINGLIHSVESDTNALRIVSQGLSTEDPIEKPFPVNNMPIGYKEWPYVWNKSKGTKKYGVSASAFQFMASGGTPGYTWSIVDGKLPDGLELNADGTIADGLVNGNVDLNSNKGIIGINTKPGDYGFTVQVTDRDGNTVRKNMTITVKERPNKWFEEGRVGALTHATSVYSFFIDPNFSADLWAERAKRQGHALVSVESIQQAYFWPSKFADPKHERHMYLPTDENGKLLDGLKKFEEAVKRYDMKFGIYYGGGIPYYTTDVYVQNVSDLIERYAPDYIYYDGPQGISNANFDVIYSVIRNYSDDIIVNSNAWGDEYGDPDLRTFESGLFSNTHGNHLVKRTVMESWKPQPTRNNYSPYYALRDDYHLVAKEMIMDIGRGYITNIDQTPSGGRGTNWDSPADVATIYPKQSQDYLDFREGLASWFAPEGKPERHESTTGTNPYFLSGYGYEDNGKGNYEKFAFPNSTTGPQWGYATYRDNNIYLHIIKGPDGKKGFNAIADKTITISPIKDNVTSVSWLNEDIPVTSFEQNGDNLTIHLDNVQEDQVDTIIKIVTDNPVRKYTLTNVKATGEQLTPSSLKIKADGFRTVPALKAQLSNVTYQSDNPGIAVVDSNGIVTPVSNGTTSITVSGSYEGVTKEDTLKVTAKDGNIYVGETMIGATLLVNGKESYGEFGSLEEASYQIEGRSSKGGPIGLVAADIRWHAGIVDVQAGTRNKPLVIKEVDPLTFKDGKMVIPFVEKLTKGVVWADVTLDGKTFTTNKVFMDQLPYYNLAKTAEITASHDEQSLQHIVDGKAIDAVHFDRSKWSVPANEQSWIQVKLPAKSEIANINLTFNSFEQKYINTPKIIKIQTSDDGVEWKDVRTVNGPTGTSYFGFYNQYPLNTAAQYVKLIFDGGSNGATIDLLEVAINGIDISSLFDRFEYEYKPVDATSGKYEIKAYSGSGELMNEAAEIVVTSENPDVIKVDESNLITAVSQGMAKINIGVKIGGRLLEEVTYLFVDQSGKMYTDAYLNKIDLNLNRKIIQANKPILTSIEGTLSTGEKADLSRATVEYQFSDERLSVIEGSNTIIVKGDIGTAFKASVVAEVTLDGVTVRSRPITIDAVADLVLQSQMTATATGQETVNENNQASMAIDGNPSTFWHTKWDNSNVLPQSITLDLGGTYNINKVGYLPRQSGSNGNITGYNVYVSTDGKSFTKVASGNWENNGVEKYAAFTSTDASHVKLEATAGVSGYASAAEINVFETIKVEKTIVDYKLVAIDTNLGIIPLLPAQIEAVYNDGTTGLVDVVWDAITADMVSNEGMFSVNGTVDGTDLKAKANVIVKSQAYYTVTIDEQITNGAVTVDKETAKKGETVIVTVTADEGYKMKAGSLKANGVEIVSSQFTMPGENVIIAAEFEVSMPPVTTDNAPIGWVNQDTIVTLNAVAGSAEVAETYFIVDDGEQQMGNSVVLSEEGVHKLVYWSVDKEGNLEQAHTVTVSIDKTAPVIEVSVPEENKIYEDSGDLTVQYTLADVLSGVDNSKMTVTLDGNPYQIDTTTPLYTLPLGQHTLVVSTTDLAGNQGSKTVSFQTVASVESLKALVTLFANNNWIDNNGIANSLQAKLKNGNLDSFVNEVQAQSGKHISSEAAEYLLRDAEYVLSQK